MKRAFLGFLLWIGFVASGEAQTSGEDFQVLGLASEQKGAYKEALGYFQGAYRAFSTAPDKKEAAQEAQLQMAKMYGELMRWDSALVIAAPYAQEQCEASLQICAKAQQILGGIWYDRGDAEKAITHYQKSLQLFQAQGGSESRATASVYQCLGNCYSYLYQLDRAQYYYQQTESILSQEAEWSDIGFVRLYNNYANISRKRGDETAARRWYQKALQLLQAFHSPEHPEAIGILHNLGLCAENPEASLRYLEQSLAINAKVLNGTHVTTGLSLMNVGNYYAEKGDAATADRYYQQALDFYRQRYAGKHPDLGHLYGNWGFLYAATQPERALDYFNRSIVTALRGQDAEAFEQAATELPEGIEQQAIWGNGGMLIIYAVIEKNHIFQQQYQKTKQPGHLQQILRHVQVADRLLDRALCQPISSGDAHQIWQAGSLVYQQVAEALAQLHQQTGDARYLQAAFAFSDKCKTVLLRRERQGDKDIRFGDLPDSLYSIERQLWRNKREYYAEWQNAQRSGWTEYAERAQQAYHAADHAHLDFLSEMRMLYPRYYQQRYALSVPTAQDIQRALPADKLLLEYFKVGDRLHIYALSAQDISQRSIVWDKQLEHNLKTLLRSVRDIDWVRQQSDSAYWEYTRAAHWLYNNLLKPELKAHPQQTQLLIIGEEQLAQLPFEVLLTEPIVAQQDYAELPYLLRQYAVNYMYSAALWLESHHQPDPASTHNILGVAPAYNDADKSPQDQLRAMRQQLAPLPFAEEEIHQLSDQYYGQFLMREHATESAFKQGNLHLYSIVHIAAHAKSSPELPLETLFFLSEDGDTLEDDLLHAYEISQLYIPANLVVLSACGTATVQWEPAVGTRSLAQAFFYAGTSSVLSTLWELNDLAGLELMKQFYQELRRKVTKSEALRRAKLAYLEQKKGLQAHPFFWAPFVLMGDDEPMTLYRQSSQGVEVLWGIAVGVALLGWYIIAALRRQAAGF